MNDRVVVIAGGLSPERDVSLRSGRRVAEDLKDAGFDAQVKDIDANLLADLLADPPTCAFPLVHGVAGEDGSLQEVPKRSTYLSWVPMPTRVDAHLTRQLPDHSLPLLASVSRIPLRCHRRCSAISAPRVARGDHRKIGLPLIIKPNRGGSALGVTVVRDAAELPAAMVGALPTVKWC